MDVCVLRCTPGHIPWYMGRTNNNNKRCQLCIRVCFVELTSIGFYIGFLVYDHYYDIVVYPLPFHLCSIPPVFALILLYHEYDLLDITCYLYTVPYACALDTIFDACLWFRFIDMRVLIYARHLASASPLARGFWLPWILMSRSRSLELVNSPSCWPEKCRGSLDLQQTVWSTILLGPPARLSSFPSVNSWALFLLLILVYPFVFSYLRLSVM